MSIKIKKFSSSTIKQLKFYVYVLTYKEQESESIFYVGKGKGDRVLSHFNKANKLDEDSLKDINISKKDNLLKHNDVYAYIIKADLTEEEAFKLEATLIEVFNKFSNKLTNMIKGKHAYEIKRVEEVESYYASPIQLQDFCLVNKINVVCIKLVDIDTYEIGKTKDFRGILEGIWKINKSRLENTDYVLGVFEERIFGIYKYIKGSAIKVSDPNWTKETWEYWHDAHYAMGRKKEFIEYDRWESKSIEERQQNKLMFKLKPISVQITQDIPEIKLWNKKDIKIGKELINRTIIDKKLKGQNVIYYFGETKTN